MNEQTSGRETFWFRGKRDEVNGALAMRCGRLDDGLTSLADDGAGRIAGNQNLQEVLAFLCSRKQENRKVSTSISQKQSPLTVLMLPKLNKMFHNHVSWA
ncbi:hypothetical protein EYF80_023876 [Liparis tanakae]|uniref:Uncharacterized protein n=1 Tax=Liparis tanakae TaxID=230148 RepID=A0A4Z2HJE1_9TELE|nr:hypothetical protein EYF80_023876 [Liparis tanakae]